MAGPVAPVISAAAVPAPWPDAAETLSGSVERVTYRGADDGFCVLRVKVRGSHRPSTVVGYAPAIQAGEFVQATGQWVNDRVHGLQFRASCLRATLPTTREGIETCLGSGLIKGIGPAYAKRLVEAFGTDLFAILEQTPERLAEVDAIGAERARRIVEGWRARRSIREIMAFLHDHDVGASIATRIFNAYGDDAIGLISKDPYRLVRELRCIGIATADAMARTLGIGAAPRLRCRAGLVQILSEAVGEGHCGLPRQDLLDRAGNRLGVERAIIEEALAAELDGGAIVADTLDGEEGVFPAALHKAQRTIVGRLQRLSKGCPPWPQLDPDRVIPAAEAGVRLALSAGQRDAISAALSTKLLVVTGGPGVGKTTLVDAVLHLLRPLGVRVALAAPTGRAAKRLSETTGAEAKTIHRLLEANPGTGAFRRNEQEPLDCDFLVVDETSMVDVSLMSALLAAVPDHAALMLVGDVDQLPSVGPGQVLRDVIDSAAVPTVRLTEIFRQAAGSRILRNAVRINQGLMPEMEPDATSDFHFVEARTPDETLRKILTILRDRIPARFGLDPIRDVQVLCPMSRGGLGSQSLNVELQRALNRRGGPSAERFGTVFRIGDKVMQIENDYEIEVYNGEVGIVAAIDAARNEMQIDFDGRRIVYRHEDLDRLVLAYAITIHKSQGSEYPGVVIPVAMQHARMLRRNLIYTGLTRGKHLVVLVGQREALALAVRTAQITRRWSQLRSRLKTQLGGR